MSAAHSQNEIQKFINELYQRGENNGPWVGHCVYCHTRNIRKLVNIRIVRAVCVYVIFFSLSIIMQWSHIDIINANSSHRISIIFFFDSYRILLLFFCVSVCFKIALRAIPSIETILFGWFYCVCVCVSAHMYHWWMEIGDGNLCYYGFTTPSPPASKQKKNTTEKTEQQKQNHHANIHAKRLISNV